MSKIMEGLNCKNCISKCGAACCGLVPISKKIFEKNKPYREFLEVVDLGDDVIFETKDFKCPYLNEENACTIYDKRPEVCKLFGSEKDIKLTCPYQDKDGRIRSRQERRMIERAGEKDMNRIFRKLKIN
jgi:hypothetical protein